MKYSTVKEHRTSSYLVTCVLPSSIFFFNLRHLQYSVAKKNGTTFDWRLPLVALSGIEVELDGLFGRECFLLLLGDCERSGVLYNVCSQVLTQLFLDRTLFASHLCIFFSLSKEELTFGWDLDSYRKGKGSFESNYLMAMVTSWAVVNPPEEDDASFMPCCKSKLSIN